MRIFAYSRRNHPCKFRWLLVQGFLRERGSNFPLFHWLALSSLKHSGTTVPAFDSCMVKPNSHFGTVRRYRILFCTDRPERANFLPLLKSFARAPRWQQIIGLYNVSRKKTPRCFTALHRMHLRSSDEKALSQSVRLSVNLSVRLSNAWIVTKRKRSVQNFMLYERSFNLVIWEEEWLVGATTSTWNFGSTGPRWSEIADFQPIFARSSLAVTSSEKSSINTNRKSTKRFPMSLRWSSYVATKSPKVGLNNAKRSISVQNRTSLEASLLQSFFMWKLSAAKL